jgi:CRP-like cAMP-binding protein
MKKPQSLKVLDGVLTSLPRGGYLADTSEGYIQFGSPPETLKDTMTLPLGVPFIFVLPMGHFDPGHGMSVAEIEFPVYWNYFIKKKKTRIYIHPDHIRNMETVLNEAVFGPEQFDILPEIEDAEHYAVPDLHLEMEYFREKRTLSDMVDLLPLDPAGFMIGGVKVSQREDGSFDVLDGDTYLCNVPGKVNFQALFDLGATISEPFVPPEFGITCLGPSHGFDPTQNTSGFILWINKAGIMIDPPANSTLWLKDSNVNPKLIDSIILTHCHADHDAGTFQKILEENRITIYTTPTVMKSFLKKYSALTRLPARQLVGLFRFTPLRINSRTDIHGATFKFWYSLHSIPTVGFHFRYRNRTFVYSSDHLNEPELIRKLFDEKVISAARRDFLLHFPWHADIIYHEAGIPPLHTPVSYLNSLPAEVQKRTTVYHIAEKDFPVTTDLRLAKFGIGETVYPDVDRHEHEEAYEILDVFSRIDVFQALPFDRIRDLLLVVKKEHFQRGDLIIRKDTPGDKFYVIISGNVSIGGLENVSDKVYATFEYFGEASLVLETPRKADVTAVTNVEAYAIVKSDFLRLIEGTDVAEEIRRIASVRDGETWQVIKSNPYFRNLSSSQVTQLERFLSPLEIRHKTELVKAGKKQDALYLVVEGIVESFHGIQFERELERGEIAGCVFCAMEGKPAKRGFRALPGTKLYRIPVSAIVHFLEENPGVYMNMAFDQGGEAG